MATGRSLLRTASVALPLAVINFYRAVLSPALAAFTGSGCRFEPSCSQYAREALLEHGLLRGGAFALARLARCHPLGGHGYDPVPPVL